MSAIKASQPGMVDFEDDEADQLQTLEDAIENINIQQFDSPVLSSTRLAYNVSESFVQFKLIQVWLWQNLPRVGRGE